jgi:hypothetical protein
MAGIRAGAITAAAKAVSKSHENEKSHKSAARTCTWRDCQSGSDKVKYSTPIRRGIQRGVHVCQRSNEVRYGRTI